LPNVNQMAILVLFDFLKNKVAPLDQYNKMGENNLCIVFGPCIMKSLEPGSLKELIYAKKIIVATSIIMK
jgi:RhoGAP domain